MRVKTWNNGRQFNSFKRESGEVYAVTVSGAADLVDDLFARRPNESIDELVIHIGHSEGEKVLRTQVDEVKETQIRIVIVGNKEKVLEERALDYKPQTTIFLPRKPPSKKESKEIEDYKYLTQVHGGRTTYPLLKPEEI